MMGAASTAGPSLALVGQYRQRKADLVPVLLAFLRGDCGPGAQAVATALHQLAGVAYFFNEPALAELAADAELQVTGDAGKAAAVVEAMLEALAPIDRMTLYDQGITA